MKSSRILSSFKSLARHACLGLVLASATSVQATVISWDGDTSIAWALGDNWGGGVAPADDITTDIARFNLPSYAGPLFAPTSGTRSITGIQIGSASGALTITTSSTGLSLGASGINMEAGAAVSSVAKVIAAVDQMWTNNSANALTVGGANVLTGRVTLEGTGQFIFSTANTGAGGVKINGAQVIAPTAQQFGTGLLELAAGSLAVNANRSFANDLSITGNFTFNAASTGPNFTSATKSTTGNVILTFKPSDTATGNTGVSFTTGAIVLGGNLEILATPGGTAPGDKIINRNFTSGFSMGGGNRTITLSESAGSGATNIGLLTLDGNLTIAGAGSTTTTLNGGFNTAGVNRTITFNNSGTGVPTLSGALTGAASTVTIAGSSTNARIGALTGTAHAINVNSSTGGSFLFNGQSTYSGGTTITNGIATVSTAGVAGVSGPLGIGALIINGGRLDSTVANTLLGSSAVTVNGGELRGTANSAFTNGGGGINLNGGTLRGLNASSSTNYAAGLIDVTGNSTIVNERSGTASGTSLNLTFSSSVSVANSQLNVTSTDNQTGGTSTVSLGDGTLTGNGILNVTDNPALTNNTVLALTTLTATGAGNRITNGNGVVSVSGLTNVGGASVGTLLVNGSLTATGGVNVASNGTLGGSGTITGAVTTTSSSSVIAPGSSAGTLSLTGTLDATAGATFKFELGSTSGSPDSDLLAISGVFTGSSLPNGLIFDFSSLAPGTSVSTPYTLLTFASSSGLDYTDLFANTLPSGLTLDTSFGTNGFLINATNLQVQFAIPEPTTLIMLLGGLGMTAMLRRRRA